MCKKGHIPWNKGIPRTIEEKKNISNSLKGKFKGRPNLKNRGKKRTNEFKQNASKISKELGLKPPIIRMFGDNNPAKRPEVRIKISNTLTGRSLSKEHKENIRKNSPKGNKCHLWKGGISFLPYCEKFNKELKIQIRNRDNNICQNCGKTEEENKQPLCVHHIHFDKENCYPDLITLCHSCHSKCRFNQEYYEELFMNILKERNLLNWKSKENKS